MTKFVIPSFQRPYIFRDTTFAFLFKHGVKPNDIYVILRDDDPYQDYYTKVCNIIKTDVRGIMNGSQLQTSYLLLKK